MGVIEELMRVPYFTAGGGVAVAGMREEDVTLGGVAIDAGAGFLVGAMFGLGGGAWAASGGRASLSGVRRAASESFGSRLSTVADAMRYLSHESAVRGGDFAASTARRMRDLAKRLRQRSNSKSAGASSTPTVAAVPGGQAADAEAGLLAWWRRGSENDAAWRELSLADKVYYEIGQKTMTDESFARFTARDAVARGRQIVAQDGPLKAIRPERPGLTLGFGTTLKSGPTPGVRWFVPRAAIGGGIIGGGLLLWHLLSGPDEE